MTRLNQSGLILFSSLVPGMYTDCYQAGSSLSQVVTSRRLQELISIGALDGVSVK